MTYEYTTRNLIYNPERYMYSAFHGKQFFEQHAASRGAVLKMLGNPLDRTNLGWLESCCIVVRDWLMSKGLGDSDGYPNQFFIKYKKSNGYVGKVQSTIPSVTDSDNILDFKALMLKQIFGQVEEGRNLIDDELWYRAVKNFEVKKTVHRFYDKDLKTGMGVYNDPEPYALMSLSCALCYVASASLIALNTQIKLNDVLCSIGPQNLNGLDKGLMETICYSELA